MFRQWVFDFILKKKYQKAIRTVWKTPDEKEKACITIRKVEKCRVTFSAADVYYLLSIDNKSGNLKMGTLCKKAFGNIGVYCGDYRLGIIDSICMSDSYKATLYPTGYWTVESY